MIKLILLATLSLGVSESIETRLPEDPAMIYTVAFDYEGVKIGLDWKNRKIVTARVCRKSELSARPACRKAALNWLNAECDYYEAKKRLNRKQRDMQTAVCKGAENLKGLIKAQQVAKR